MNGNVALRGLPEGNKIKLRQRINLNSGVPGPPWWVTLNPPENWEKLWQYQIG